MLCPHSAAVTLRPPLPCSSGSFSRPIRRKPLFRMKTSYWCSRLYPHLSNTFTSRVSLSLHRSDFTHALRSEIEFLSEFSYFGAFPGPSSRGRGDRLEIIATAEPPSQPDMTFPVSSDLPAAASSVARSLLPISSSRLRSSCPSGEALTARKALLGSRPRTPLFPYLRYEIRSPWI